MTGEVVLATRPSVDTAAWTRNIETLVLPLVGEVDSLLRQRYPKDYRDPQ
jgi:hypothetical protein